MRAPEPYRLRPIAGLGHYVTGPVNNIWSVRRMLGSVVDDQNTGRGGHRVSESTTALKPNGSEAIDSLRQIAGQTPRPHLQGGAGGKSQGR